MDERYEQDISRLLRESAELRRRSEELRAEVDRLRREAKRVVEYLPVEHLTAKDAVLSEPPTVLVVDDEPSVRHIATRLLTDAGFRVLTAMSGADALRQLEEARTIHVLVTDLRMPGMSGIELAVQVRQRCPEARVVVITGYPSDEVLEWPLVVKPFPSGVLEAEIRRALDGPNARGGSGQHTARE
jgi:CheY-like chemotaxis protein